MAAGVSLDEQYVDEFRSRLNEVCTLAEDDLVEKIVIDVPMPISYVKKELIREMEVLEPFGKGNTKPVFAQKNLRALECRIFGKNRNVVKMKLMDETGTSVDAVYFGEGDAFVRMVKEKGRFSAVYYPDINVWQGRESVQIVITRVQ